MRRETGGFGSFGVDPLDDDVNPLESHDSRHRQATGAENTERASAATWARLLPLAYGIERVPRTIANGLSDFAAGSTTDSEVAW